MITKIQAANLNTGIKRYSSSPVKYENSYQDTNLPNSFDPDYLQNYFISFTGRTQSKYEQDYQFDNTAVNIINKAKELAKKYKHKEVNQYHFLAVAFSDTLDYIDKLNKGEADLYLPDNGEGPSYFSSLFSKKIFENLDYRSKFTDVLKEELSYVNNILNNMSVKPEGQRRRLVVSDLFYNDVENIRQSDTREDTIVNGYDIYNGAFCSMIPKISNSNDEFRLKVNDILMLENKEADKRLHFSNYDKKAENILKNLNMGTNMFITYDHTKVNPQYFVPSIIKAFNNSNGKFNPSNTEIIEFNSNVNMDHFTNKLKALSKNKDKNYIIIYSQMNMYNNSLVLDDNMTPTFTMTADYLNFAANTPENMRIIVFDAKDNYLKYLQNKTIAFSFNNFGELSIPVLNTKDVLGAIIENKDVLQNTNSKISKKALEKIVSETSRIDGTFPDKTLDVIKKITSHYIDKQEITPKDVDLYFKEADYLFNKINNNSSFEIVFDTGKRLKDIIGKTNTKKEAEYLIRQIKQNKIGTKGFIIYSQDGTVGGGRRHTAEVVAGESGVPFVSINTMDFGTKEVDLFGDSTMSPEASIKKIFSLVSTQAEANPHKAAVLFIENFEYFSVGELVSLYHQKAMAQLIREMEQAEKKGLNIVVMGSVSNPSLLGEAAMKSFKFNDNIEVSSPAYNEKERFEILEQIVRKNNVKIAGTREEQNKMLIDMAKTLEGFSFIELKSFIKKAESIASERNHKQLTKADMIESFLRITTGRPATRENYPHEKELTTRHECGHAITLQIMNDLFKKAGQPWKIPTTVNFITLDPRGYYGGAMYHKNDINREFSFEKAFTDIVCSYGGHSAEKYFYDMDGSYGISADLENVSFMAQAMVEQMGQGFYTGKLSLSELGSRETLTQNMLGRIESDINVITKNALTVSDAIVETYSDFIREFSDKYAHLVGTGDCLIDGDTFRQELADWKSRQSEEKLAELETLDNIILDAIKSTKNGKIY